MSNFSINRGYFNVIRLFGITTITFVEKVPNKHCLNPFNNFKMRLVIGSQYSMTDLTKDSYRFEIASVFSTDRIIPPKFL